MRLLNSWSAKVALTAFLLCSDASAAETSALEPQASSGQAVTVCAWSQVPDEDRAAILKAYHQASLGGIETHMRDFSQTLAAHDNRLRRAFAACDSNPNIPKILAQEALETQAIQAGAAAELEATHLVLRPHISRAELDDAWSEAPEAAVQCVRADAGKTFGLKDLPCPDPKAVFWLLRKFGLNPDIQSDRPVAEQVLIFYDAKAQGEYVEAILAHLDKDLTAKPAS